jgi:hypothetical protein
MLRKFRKSASRSSVLSQNPDPKSHSQEAFDAHKMQDPTGTPLARSSQSSLKKWQHRVPPSSTDERCGLPAQDFKTTKDSLVDIDDPFSPNALKKLREELEEEAIHKREEDSRTLEILADTGLNDFDDDYGSPISEADFNELPDIVEEKQKTTMVFRSSQAGYGLSDPAFDELDIFPQGVVQGDELNLASDISKGSGKFDSSFARKWMDEDDF